MIKPYLIIPKLIEQPTWGGEYIVAYKGWKGTKKIGQSYELYGKSKLAADITDTNDERFGPDLESTVGLEDLVNENPGEMLGPEIAKQYGKMPLLIKFTQALGNSFQLHIKPGTIHPRWKPKAESWYYFEDGYISFGIKQGIDLELYKKVCIQINEKMMELRHSNDAKAQAKAFIQKLNPWQFVNLHQVKKYDLVDLSAGGLHHSWEENFSIAPLGNVLYEVQQDVSDDEATIRSFDQGKFKEDGDIRPIHINDYFQFLDTSESANILDNAKRLPHGNNLLSTPVYKLDLLTVNKKVTESTGHSFVHLFVRDGDVDVSVGDTILHVGKGHSCFIPWAVQTFDVASRTYESVMLKTYV